VNSLPFSPIVLAALAAVFVGGSLLLMRALEQQDKVKARLSRVANPNLPVPVDTQLSGGGGGGTAAVDLVAKMGSALARSGLLPAATRAEFEQTLSQAGLRNAQGLGLFIGSKVLGMTLLPLMTYLAFHGGKMQPITFYVTMAVSFAVGMLGPDFVLRQMRASHLKKVERGLPDALDMMVICAQAGLALENAIERVAVEFAAANRAVSEELAVCASELRIGADRRTALLSLGDRTGLDNMKRFAATLIQTMQFGTPLTHALRVLASEMRTDTLTKFEEKAAKLPVMLTFPMILFILPCVFIVVGGPAAVRIQAMFHGMH
jgi:tight adherence protein C